MTPCPILRFVGGATRCRFGKRRLLVISLLVFLVGSVGAALSPSIGALIGFRALQGVGGAVFPLSFVVVRDEFPPVRVGGAIGVLTGGFGIGWAAGMVLGGVIASALSWRYVFVVGAILILAATALVETLVPRSPERAPSRDDAVGALLLGGGLAALLVALTEGPTVGWGSGAIGAGLFLLPAAIGQVVAGPLAGRAARMREPRLPLVAGMALLAGGAAILAVGAGAKAAVLVGMLALGLGFGSSRTPASTLVTQAVSARQSGVASALNSVVRRVGGGVGGQVGAALLAAITVAYGSDPSRAAFTAAFAVTAAIGALGLLCAAVMPGDGAAHV